METDYIKIFKILFIKSKDIFFKKSKNWCLNCDQIFASHITDSGLVSPIFKQLITHLRKR